MQANKCIAEVIMVPIIKRGMRQFLVVIIVLDQVIIMYNSPQHIIVITKIHTLPSDQAIIIIKRA